MRRITKQDLETQIRVAEMHSRGHGLPDPDLGLDWAYGGVRVTNRAGSEDLSPRGSKREAYNWLSGFNSALFRQTRKQP